MKVNKYVYEWDELFHNKVLVQEGECLVCKHCTDVFCDYTNGPYMTICEYTVKNEDGEDEDLSDFKVYGAPCDKYEYDGIERKVIEGEKR